MDELISENITKTKLNTTALFAYRMGRIVCSLRILDDLDGNIAGNVPQGIQIMIN